MKRSNSQAKLLFLLLATLLVGNSIFADCCLAQEEVSDPLESFNRGVFWFNDQFDTYLLKPAATGYDYITPKSVQRSVENFFSNLKFPVFLVSDLVQLKFDQAADHTGRFLVNSTIGVGGLFDLAKEFGLEPHHEDFGTALGYHGVGPGFYLVLPILGPSSGRDLLGKVADSFLDPFYHMNLYTNLDSEEIFYINAGLKTVDAINTRASLLDAIDSAKEASLDYYLFVRSAYFQRRQNLIYDNEPPEAEDQEPEVNDAVEEK